MLRKITLLVLVGLFCQKLSAQNDYKNFSQLSNSLKQLASKNSSLAQLKAIGKSVQGREIWLLTLTKGGKAEEKPAICLVAGIDAFHLAGVESSLQIAENLLQNASKDSVQKVLEQKTIYIVPCLNPDAYEQAFAKVKYERNFNASNSDNDRDGKLNEDSFEDLNNDGYITLVRIEDATGEYKPHKDDSRIMVKADATKGETGSYILITEGIDNDKDGKWNEDAEGGIVLNKNFTFNYPFFTDGAGEYAVSEPENRALLDFLYEAKNVYAVFQFGVVNNLTEPNKYDKQKATQKIIAGWQEKDVKINEQVSKLYEKAGLKNYPSLPTQGGNFTDWAYFHYGRLSFGTPVWAIPKDTAKKNAIDNEEVRFLRWAEANKVPNVFLDWKSINHPDFPNKKAEIGGIVPFVRYNPPMNFLKESIEKHTKFFTEFLWQMPSLQITNVRTESLSGGLTRITLDIHNKGLLPTHSELGEKTRHVDKLKVEVLTSKNQNIVAGKRKEVIRKPLGAGEKLELSWIIAGSGEVQIQMHCATATNGKESVKVSLK
ncbi:MAG: M14 family metallopeptidase [Raineya sp.]|nr:M14 family metallopeptidase [Raineya sp.]